MEIKGLKEIPILGILRDLKLSEVKDVFQTSFDAGLRTIEITLNTDNALEIIRVAVDEFSIKMDIGAGTVLTLKDCKRAVNAGAKFIVAPNLNLEIAKFCKQENIPYIPGALTPSEVYNAWIVSEFMVKIFPASLVGPKYFKELKGPYKNIQLMAVGGVTPETMKDYFDNGASAISFGGQVYKREWIENKGWDKISEQIAKYIAVAKEIR